MSSSSFTSQSAFYSYPSGRDDHSAQESPFAQTLREADERFYATFPAARIAAEQQGRLPYSKPVHSFGVPLYYDPQQYQGDGADCGGYFTEGYATNPRDCATASSIESTLHYTYLSAQHPTQHPTSSQPNIDHSVVQQGLIQSPQYPAGQSSLDDVPPLEWATAPAIVQGPTFQSFYPSHPAGPASSLPDQQNIPQIASPHSPTSYSETTTSPLVPVTDYQETVYHQQSGSVPQSSPVPQQQQQQQQHVPLHHPQLVHRHPTSKERKSQSYPYPQTQVKEEAFSNPLPSPVASPIRPTHHARHSSHTDSPPRRLSWSPGRSSPSRQSGSTSRPAIPLSPLPSKRQIEKKPPLACLFCRGRKIACGPPLPGSPDRTCNQCQRRCLRCEYPAESRRGMRKKKVTGSTDSPTEQAQPLATTPPTFPGEGTLEP